MKIVQAHGASGNLTPTRQEEMLLAKLRTLNDTAQLHVRAFVDQMAISGEWKPKTKRAALRIVKGGTA